MKVKNNMSLCITNIQRFSLHDGPGIRTTVFLKGCSIRCPWCANPENIEPKIESYSEKNDKDECGKFIEVEQLYEYIMRDEIFYTNGGVTFSGGEPLLQMKALERLLIMLKEKGIHLCAETALFVPEALLDIAIKYFDIFYVDIKILDADKCRSVLKGDLKVYIKNIDRLLESKRRVIFRIPLIAGYTFEKENVEKIKSFIKERKIAEIELIKGHNLGRDKAIALGIKHIEVKDITKEKIVELKYQLEVCGATIKVCEV